MLTILLGLIGGTELILLLIIVLLIVSIIRFIRKRMSIEFKLKRALKMFEDKLINEKEYELMKERLIHKKNI